MLQLPLGHRLLVIDRIADQPVDEAEGCLVQQYLRRHERARGIGDPPLVEARHRRRRRQARTVAQQCDRARDATASAGRRASRSSTVRDTALGPSSWIASACAASGWMLSARIVLSSSPSSSGLPPVAR